MDDLISRQAAIDALIAEGRNVDSHYLESERIIVESDAVEALSILPSADRPRGEWLARDCVFGVVYCSECGYELRQNDTNYCPNCGADMRGGES